MWELKSVYGVFFFTAYSKLAVFDHYGIIVEFYLNLVSVKPKMRST